MTVKTGTQGSYPLPPLQSVKTWCLFQRLGAVPCSPSTNGADGEDDIRPDDDEEEGGDEYPQRRDEDDADDGEEDEEGGVDEDDAEDDDNVMRGE